MTRPGSAFALAAALAGDDVILMLTVGGLGLR